MTTLDEFSNDEIIGAFGADEIIACDPRSKPRRRGTIIGVAHGRLWVQWFGSGLRRWIPTNQVFDWRRRTGPIPRRGYVVGYHGSC